MRYFIVSWDCHGVEFFKEITEHHPDNWARANLFDSIKNGAVIEKQLGFNLTALKLRAQYNPQRNYEIYVFTSEDNIAAAEIEEWFTLDPQVFADWVRENHSLKIWDDRNRVQHRVII